MKTLYQASNNLEAHMILNLLAMQGISGRVDGEFLQGGVGELPAVGLVRVMVAEEDYAAAKSIVEEWDASQTAEESDSSPRRSSNTFVNLGLGFIVGFVCAYAYFGAEVTDSGIDHSGDGKFDEIWTYSRNGRILKYEADRNLDKEIDLITSFNKDGAPSLSKNDDNFDGTYESLTKYERGNPLLIESDTDGDGYRDFKTNFLNGVTSSIEYIYPASGYPYKIEYLKLGKVSHSEIDIDKDGKMDKRTYYNDIGEVKSVENIE